MRKNIVAGNWKMNGSKASVVELLEGIKKGAHSVQNVDLIVFPSFPFLAEIQNNLENSNIAWGAQNLSYQASGAYTGEVSADMLKDFGCRYVLVGHSERRTIFAETDAVVAAKFDRACQHGLIPVLCIGETLEEREQNKTIEVVTRQLEAVLQLEHGVEYLYNSIIAYEPVWAIGTGLTATPEQAQEIHRQIRALISKHDANLATQLQILYGGSVKPSNAKELFSMPDIDGGLIGGASLNANDFIEIGKSCNN